MSTMSFSVEDSIKRDFSAWAKRAKKSKSDLFRDMVTVYRFNQSFKEFTDTSEELFKTLNITSEQDLYDYLESDETYEDRIRH